MNRRLLVDLEALAANYRHFTAAAATGQEVGAVVKADGYGLGVTAVVAGLIEAGCKSFFVSSATEGLALAQAFKPAPFLVYVLEGPDPDSAGQLADAGIVPVINHAEQLEIWRDHAGLPVAVHVDTGMARLGFTADLAPEMLDGFQVRLLLTHLACADEPDHPANERQLRRFDEVRARFPGVRSSIGNSAGWLGGTPCQGDLGRPGIGLYGGNPFSLAPNPMRAVASLEGKILQLRYLPAGETVGYGATFEAARPTRVAVVALGYADGVPRLLSNRGEMAVGGVRCPILGRVSMDMTMLDVTDVPAVTGDWVECFGPTIAVDEVAQWAETIAYEVLTGLGPRVVRRYLPARPA